MSIQDTFLEKYSSCIDISATSEFLLHFKSKDCIKSSHAYVIDINLEFGRGVYRDIVITQEDMDLISVDDDGVWSVGSHTVQFNDRDLKEMVFGIKFECFWE